MGLWISASAPAYHPPILIDAATPRSRTPQYAPFIDAGDDLLSQICQMQIFFSLLSTIILQANPNSPLMGVLLPMLIAFPPLSGFIFESGVLEELAKLSGGDNGWPIPFTGGKRVGVGLKAKTVSTLERILGVKQAPEEPEEEDADVVESTTASSIGAFSLANTAAALPSEAGASEIEASEMNVSEADAANGADGADGGLGAEVDPPLPEGWAAYQTHTGRTYYYHKVSKKTMWRRPTEAAAPVCALCGVVTGGHVCSGSVTERTDRTHSERESPPRATFARLPRSPAHRVATGGVETGVPATPTSAHGRAAFGGAITSAPSTSPKGEPPLPEGWAASQTPGGRTYYYHKASKKTMWRRPTEGYDLAAEAVPSTPAASNTASSEGMTGMIMPSPIVPSPGLTVAEERELRELKARVAAWQAADVQAAALSAAPSAAASNGTNALAGVATGVPAPSRGGLATEGADRMHLDREGSGREAASPLEADLYV